MGDSTTESHRRHRKQKRLEARISPEQERVLELCEEAREVFVKALINPPAPNEALEAAADRYKKHIRS